MMRSLSMSVRGTGTLPHSSLEPFQSGWPSWLLVLSVLLIFAPLLEGGTTHLAVMIIRLLILLLASLYLAKAFQAGRLKIPALCLETPLLAFLGLATLSTILSPYTNQSLQWLVALSSYALLLYLMVSFFNRWDQILKVLAVVVGLGLGEAGWALIQVGWFGALRPNGTFFNPNFLAAYLIAIWSVLLGVLVYARMARDGHLRMGPHKLGHVGLYVFVLGGLLSSVIWTGSRGGLVTLVVATGLLIGLRFGMKGVSAIVGVAAIALLLPNPLSERLRAEHVLNPVGYARLQIWQSSLREMLDHPLGIGLGLYQYGYPQYAFPIEGHIARFGKLAHTAHNEYLQIGVELGVAGLLMFLWGVVAVARESTAVLALRLRRWQRGVMVGACAAVAGLLTHASFDSNLHEPSLAILLIGCVSILLSGRRLAGKELQADRMVSLRARLSRWMAAGAAVVLVGLMVLYVSRVGVAWLAFESGSRAQAHQNLSQAIAGYQAAVALDSGKALYRSALAAAYFQAFEKTQDETAAQAALSELESAIALNPLDGRLPGLLGHVYVSLAKSRGTLKASDPRVGTGVQGQLQSQKTTWLKAARSAYERAMALEPYSVLHRLELGRILWALNDREAAQTIVEQAVAMEPNFLPGREWLARRYLSDGRLEMARNQYQEILDRQNRYAGWTKDFVEEQFMKVDPMDLKKALEKRSGLS